MKFYKLETKEKNVFKMNDVSDAMVNAISSFRQSYKSNDQTKDATTNSIKNTVSQELPQVQEPVIENQSISSTDEKTNISETPNISSRVSIQEPPNDLVDSSKTPVVESSEFMEKIAESVRQTIKEATKKETDEIIQKLQTTVRDSIKGKIENESLMNVDEKSSVKGNSVRTNKSKSSMKSGFEKIAPTDKLTKDQNMELDSNPPVVLSEKALKGSNPSVKSVFSQNKSVAENKQKTVWENIQSMKNKNDENGDKQNIPYALMFNENPYNVPQKLIAEITSPNKEQLVDVNLLKRQSVKDSSKKTKENQVESRRKTSETNSKKERAGKLHIQRNCQTDVIPMDNKNHPFGSITSFFTSAGTTIAGVFK